MRKCDICHVNDVRIIIEGVGHLCLDCHNKAMAEELGVELFDQYAKNLSVYDNIGQIHSFEISNLILPLSSIWRAEEIGGGYDFEVMIDIDEEQLVGIKHLHSKILRGVGYKTLYQYEENEKSEYTMNFNSKQYGLKEVGTAGIYYDFETEKYCLMIDGKKVSFEEFGNMASNYEGFTLDFQIRDKSDEVLGKDMVLKQVNIQKDKIYSNFERTISWFVEDNILNDNRADAFEEAIDACIDDYDLVVKYGKLNEAKELGESMIERLMEIKFGPNYSPRFIFEDIEEIMNGIILEDEYEEDFEDEDEDFEDDNSDEEE